MFIKNDANLKNELNTDIFPTAKFTKYSHLYNEYNEHLKLLKLNTKFQVQLNLC